ncbi:MAG: hypothetical protein AAF685_16645 [Cyanobacteria bacterium P01_C01_bin.89]
MQLKDLTVEEFRQLLKVWMRETVEEVLQEISMDEESHLPLKSEFRQSLLERREERLQGKSKTYSTEEVMERLGLKNS